MLVFDVYLSLTLFTSYGQYFISDFYLSSINSLSVSQPFLNQGSYFAMETSHDTILSNISLKESRITQLFEKSQLDTLGLIH